MENTNSVSMIIKKVISEINSGKSRIYKIVDNLSDEFQKKNEEFEKVKREIEEVIKRVDELHVLDKKMRIVLADASKMKGADSEKIMEETYEKALEIRVEYVTKQSEEKDLRRRRDSL
ncbi:MAG: sensor histidine kinase, partial [Clostridium sp.]